MPRAERLRVGVAPERDRDRIYRLRHEVYASELRQHPENEAGTLTDELDSFNDFLTVSSNRELLAFVAITPPGRRYSIDKYFPRCQLPLTFDDGLYEVRLLTVAPPHRNSSLASVLMYAALRWVEAHGGDTVVAIGRRELLDFYLKVGLRPLARQVEVGAVTYELMSATTVELCEQVPRYERLVRRLERSHEWDLGVPLRPSVSCFHGGAFFEAIGTRFDKLDKRRSVISADVLDAWFPPSPRVTAALREHLPWLLSTSPPAHAEGLIETIAERREVDSDCLIAGAGSSDLIYLAFRHWLSPESRVLILDPSYGEYEHIFKVVIGCRTERFQLQRRNGFELDLHALEARLRSLHDLVVVVNPNSPTGVHVPRVDLERLLTRIPRRTRAWIDETYVDYVGAEESLERFATTRKNVFVCKSMSKVYALSGARVGYLCGPAEELRELQRLRPAWSVSLTAQVAAVHALSDPDYYARRYRETHELREHLARRLGRISKLEVMPGTTNFLLCFLPPGGPGAQAVVEACRTHNVFLRNAGNMGRGLGDHAIRIAVKDRPTNRRIAHVLAGVLCQGASRL